MPVNFACPHCGAATEVAERYLGQSGPCASCGAQVTVPLPKPSTKVPPKPSATHRSAMGAVLTVMVTVCVGCLVCGGLLVALLIPAGAGAREAARRMRCTNNLKQIGIAMHNYHDAYGALPPAYTVDTKGRRLHSWRTLLLPFLDQAALYEQINLEQPWDSPHNQTLANQWIPLYQCPSHSERHTAYMAIVGPGTSMEGEKSVTIGQVIDGAANTLLIVEVKGQSINWMEPVDLELEQLTAVINGGRADGIGSNHPGGANVVFVDGSIHFLSQEMSPQQLTEMITRGGGEPIRPQRDRK